MGRIEEDPQAHREAMELRALENSRRRPAGPPGRISHCQRLTGSPNHGWSAMRKMLILPADP